MKDFIKKHWILIVSLIYVIFPLDFISDIFGPFGLVDDFSLVILALIREFVIYRKAKQDIEKNKDKI
jgi:uncharacterized membrane protein YkvA (DUF1232 family)